MLGNSFYAIEIGKPFVKILGLENTSLYDRALFPKSHMLNLSTKGKMASAKVGGQFCCRNNIVYLINASSVPFLKRD